MKPLQAVSILLLFLYQLQLSTAIDYQCFLNRIKIHPSECCDNGFLFNRAKLNKCIKLFSIEEFLDTEGLWENSCMAECYFNETAINSPGGIDRRLTLTMFQSHPYLTAVDIEKCWKDANKYSLAEPLLHNVDAELIHDSTKCQLNSQTLAVCLEERIYFNCPQEKRLKDSYCFIQAILDECNGQPLSTDQLFGVAKVPINN